VLQAHEASGTAVGRTALSWGPESVERRERFAQRVATAGGSSGPQLAAEVIASIDPTRVVFSIENFVRLSDAADDRETDEYDETDETDEQDRYGTRTVVVEDPSRGSGSAGTDDGIGSTDSSGGNVEGGGHSGDGYARGPTDVIPLSLRPRLAGYDPRFLLPVIATVLTTKKEKTKDQHSEGGSKAREANDRRHSSSGKREREKEGVEGSSEQHSASSTTGGPSGSDVRSLIDVGLLSYATMALSSDNVVLRKLG
jgi:hypothetical protein